MTVAITTLMVTAKTTTTAFAANGAPAHGTGVLCWACTGFFAAVLVQHFDFQCTGQVGPDKLPTGTIAVRTENGKRVVVFGTHQGIDVLCGRQ